MAKVSGLHKNIYHTDLIEKNLEDADKPIVHLQSVFNN
jgi:hypothetical protein